MRYCTFNKYCVFLNKEESESDAIPNIKPQQYDEPNNDKTQQQKKNRVCSNK